MTLELIHNKTTTTKLTVTGDGNIRIKFAVGLSDEDERVALERLWKVAQKVIDKKYCHTMRGVAGDVGITMYNNAKSHSSFFYWDDL